MTTLENLCALAAEFPDAPKWWIGDWANEGSKRYGVSVEQAIVTGAHGARALRSDSDRKKERLPGGVEATVTGLKMPDDFEREDWAKLGAWFFAIEAETADIEE